MRLSDADIKIIRSLVHTQLGKGANIWVFGSRLDDTTAGGDIDLYIELPDTSSGDRVAGNHFLIRETLRRDLERQLRKPVDLLINPGDDPSAFMRQAREEGCRL